jgi:hypothetical protein
MRGSANTFARGENRAGGRPARLQGLEKATGNRRRTALGREADDDRIDLRDRLARIQPKAKTRFGAKKYRRGAWSEVVLGEQRGRALMVRLARVLVPPGMPSGSRGQRDGDQKGKQNPEGGGAPG